MKQTEIIKTDLEKPKLKVIKKAAKVIRSGGLVIYPTETCYGLGTNVLNAKAVKSIYIVKKRPFSVPLTAIVSDIKMAKKYGYVDKRAEYLVRKYMPGPLTIVVKKKKSVPDVFDSKEFAFRVPGNRLALEIVKYAKVPIVATSANIHNNPLVYSAQELIKTFDKKVDIILDASNLKRVKPSTIVSLMKKIPEIRREGSISGRKVLKVLEKFKLVHSH